VSFKKLFSRKVIFYRNIYDFRRFRLKPRQNMGYLMFRFHYLIPSTHPHRVFISGTSGKDELSAEECAELESGKRRFRMNERDLYL
jgi:hypothetical protein